MAICLLFIVLLMIMFTILILVLIIPIPFLTLMHPSMKMKRSVNRLLLQIHQGRKLLHLMSRTKPETRMCALFIKYTQIKFNQFFFITNPTHIQSQFAIIKKIYTYSIVILFFHPRTHPGKKQETCQSVGKELRLYIQASQVDNIKTMEEIIPKYELALDEHQIDVYTRVFPLLKVYLIKKLDTK